MSQQTAKTSYYVAQRLSVYDLRIQKYIIVGNPVYNTVQKIAIHDPHVLLMIVHCVWVGDSPQILGWWIFRYEVLGDERYYCRTKVSEKSKIKDFPPVTFTAHKQHFKKTFSADFATFNPLLYFVDDFDE